MTRREGWGDSEGRDNLNLKTFCMPQEVESEHNINENYTISIKSALQTSPTYLRRTDQNNPLNRKSTLNTSFHLNGYDVLESNDILRFTIAGYQVVRNDEDNKTTPTSFPYIYYNTGNRDFKGNTYKNYFTTYNIFRDKSTSEHSQQQQKIGYTLKSQKEFFSLYSKLTFKTELHTQFYNIESKKNGNDEFSGTYSRIHPMTGLYIETPFANHKNNIFFTPKLFGIFNSSQSNSNKISNEDSTDYKYSLLNFSEAKYIVISSTPLSLKKKYESKQSGKKNVTQYIHSFDRIIAFFKRRNFKLIFKSRNNEKNISCDKIKFKTHSLNLILRNAK